MLRDATCSVLVARPASNAEAWPRTVVAGVDGSLESAAAFTVARSLARRFGGSVRAVASAKDQLDREAARAIAPGLEEHGEPAVGGSRCRSRTGRSHRGRKPGAAGPQGARQRQRAHCQSSELLRARRPSRARRNEAEVDALPSVKPARARPGFGVTRVEVSGFRSARDVAFSPAPLCALVGEADAGKSNLLAAIRAVLDPAAAPLTAADMAAGGDGAVSIRVSLADGGEAALEGSPGRTAVSGGATAPPTLFLPAEERAGAMLAAWTPRREASRRQGLRARARPAGPDARQHGHTPFSKRSSPAARKASAVSCF